MRILRAALGGTIAGAYLFGSAVTGGLRPRSDLDILVVVRTSPTAGARRGLVTGLMAVSTTRADGAAGRPVEVTVVKLSDVVPWRYPPKAELVYGEWLRPEFEAGTIPAPAVDPDLAIVLAAARKDSVALIGPSAASLFGPVPTTDLRRAIWESLPVLLREIRGDERNVLLTLARMWVSIATGEIVSKDAAAQWMLERVPPEHKGVLEMARQAYLGEGSEAASGRGGECVRAIC